MKKLYSCLILLAALTSTVLGEDRPNILWITSEDNSAYWLGCYGNKNAQTPNLDRLAERGILYEHAYANAPVCAVARSTLILGSYAPSLGLQHMRSQYAIPERFKAYPEYLREAGYYVTNNSKTDFNYKADMSRLWDETSGTAHWMNRAPGQPFFAIFNTTISHESSLFHSSIDHWRKLGVYPAEPRVDPADVVLPPFLPDDPEIREDHAIYHDAVSAMDAFVGERLAELEEAGVAEDTIVFYYSDHGGVIPREKRFLYDTGTRVPLIIYFPEKWAHLAPGEPGSQDSRLVSFADFGPTLLSLCGIPVPELMQGKAFLGEQGRGNVRTDVFLYGHRYDAEMPKFERAITDGEYRYIRNFHPFNPQCYPTGYPYRQDGWKAWKAAYERGETNAIQGSYWAPPQPVDALYNTERDPWEVNDLVGNRWYAERLASMKERLYTTMLETRDTGVIPESMFYQLFGKGAPYDYVNHPDFPYVELLDLLFLATDGDPANVGRLQDALCHPHPVARYWGLIGCAILGEEAASSLPWIRKLQEDPYEGIQFAAAYAILNLGHEEEAVNALKQLVSRPVTTMAPVDALYVLQSLGVSDFVTLEMLERIQAETDGDTNLGYVYRAANTLYAHFHPGS